MTRGQVWTWSLLAFFAGGGLIFYLLRNVSPQLADGQTNTSAVLLFLVGLFVLATGLGGMVALLLHKRWPVLAGVRGPRRQTPIPGVAMRQGLLLGVAVVAVVVLALLGFLDLVFVLVTFVLLGLLEVFLQSRQHA